MKIDKKRRRERKTNYSKRLKLLKVSHPRLVIRKTNKYLIAQIVESEHAQDKIVYSVSTKELLKHGWPKEKQGSLKSLAAGYLAGFLLGKKSRGIKNIVLDTGLIPSTKGSRVYAFVLGFADSGMNIPFGEGVAPKIEIIKKDYDFFDSIKKEIEGIK